jgi:hypothetical protein
VKASQTSKKGKEPTLTTSLLKSEAVQHDSDSEGETLLAGAVFKKRRGILYLAAITNKDSQTSEEERR